jgi:hypothetical protein
MEEKLRAVYHECAVREHIISENAKKLRLSPRFEGLDQEPMQMRVKKSQDQIKIFENALRSKNVEYEKLKREMMQA